MNNDFDNYEIYGLFQGKKKKAVTAFSTKGWDSRKSSWTEYELNNDWSEIEIYGEEPTCLFHANVSEIDKNIYIIADILRNTFSQWNIEIYDAQNKLIKEIRSTKFSC